MNTMKTVAVGVLLCMCVPTTSAQAQVVYKCVVREAITYQQTPCEAPAPAKGGSSNTALIGGQWRYDRDATMAWAKRHAKLTKEQDAELEGLAGHLTYTFMTGQLSLERTAYDLTQDGVVRHEKDIRKSTPYNVVSSSAQMITIAAQNPDSLSMYTTDIHFEGGDMFWISLANQKLTAVDNANAREYFKRVR